MVLSYALHEEQDWKSRKSGLVMYSSSDMDAI